MNANDSSACVDYLGMSEEIDRSNRWFKVAIALGQQDDFIEMLNAERLRVFIAVLRSLGCTCSPGVRGTDTGWWTDPKCPLHGA